jgi:hypothetical protein
MYKKLMSFFLNQVQYNELEKYFNHENNILIFLF